MTIETADDARAVVLARLMDDAGIPLHIRYGNTALADELQAEAMEDYARSPDVVVMALRRRKLAACPACRGEAGGHTEIEGARTADFTPGSRQIR